MVAVIADPILPPGFTLTVLPAGQEAFVHACRHAPELGAASLVWVRRDDLLDFAVVLEPDQPLSVARLAHYAAMNAVADALSAHCPPEKPVRFEWPDAFLFDLGLLGGGQLAWPEGCAEEAVPDWIVFGAMLRVANPDAGDYDRSRIGLSMEEAGFEDVTQADLIEAFCRHLMLNVHRWQSDGPKAIARRWLDRLEAREGVKRGIEPNGDLVQKADGSENRESLIEALRRRRWFDAKRREPKL